MRLSTSCRFAWLVTLGSLVLAMDAVHASPQCRADCDNDQHVDGRDVMMIAAVILGTESASQCAMDYDLNGEPGVTIGDLVVAVNDARTGICHGDSWCGDGIVGLGEDCDPGGICVGGARSGMACTSESQCGSGEPGRCQGGTRALSQCTSDSQCGGGLCRRCMMFGGLPVAGGTCAADCDFETDVPIVLEPGEFSGPQLIDGSGAVVHSGILGDVPLPIRGSLKLKSGKPDARGQRPLTIKATDLALSPIPVSTLACACMRGIAAKTCGGVLTFTDGSRSPDCSLGSSPGDSVCRDGLPPCAFVHGPDNAGSGVLGCNGLSPINLEIAQDSRGSNDPLACLTPDTGAPVCADEAQIRIVPSTGGPGSILMTLHSAIGIKVGSCSGFCTDNDPPSQRGAVSSLYLTTGAISATVFNADGQDNIDNGPHFVRGNPKPCPELFVDPSGLKLAGAFTAINQSMLGDIVVTACFEAQ